MVLMHQTLLPNLVNLLVECRTLWGEPERVHVQNMEQLHAHDHYQYVTEQNLKPQYMKQNLHTCTIASFPGLHAQVLSLAVRKTGEGLGRFIT